MQMPLPASPQGSAASIPQQLPRTSPETPLPLRTRLEEGAGRRAGLLGTPAPATAWERREPRGPVSRARGGGQGADPRKKGWPRQQILSPKPEPQENGSNGV